MSSRPLLRLLHSRATQIRPFTHTTPFLAAAGSRSAKRPPPVPSYTSKPKQAQKLAVAQNQPQPPPAAPPAVRSEAPPAAQSLKSARDSRTESYASGLLGNADELLLYKAPRNASLFASCMTTGVAIQFWAATVANDLVQSTMPWYATSIMLAGCLISSGMASAIMLTPHHLVKSISLVRAGDGNNKEAVMRVKGTTLLPFIKPTVMDMSPGQMMVDSNVTMSLETTKQWFGVPLKNGKVWTEGALRRPGEPEGNAIAKFNKSLLNIAPAAFSHVRKMFNRDGMAYARIGGSNWKMDLEGCEILANGEVLMKLVKEGAVRTNLVSLAARTMFSK